MVVFLVNKIAYISPYSPLPSSPMVIRRYRSLEESKYLDTYFTEGLYCNRLTEFDDDDEGMLEQVAQSGTTKGMLAADSARDVDVASDEDFQEAFEEYHNDARFQHYANCRYFPTDQRHHSPFPDLVY